MRETQLQSGATALCLPSVEDQIVLLPPADVESTLGLLVDHRVQATVVMLDPWYNKGVGGVRDDYDSYISRLLELSARIGEHVFLWGFPEIVARFVTKLPAPLVLTAW